MAKRRRSPPESENWSDGGTSNIASDSESDFDDASFAQKPKGSRSGRRTATVAPKKAKVARNDASTSSAPQEICGDFTPHSKSVHTISSPAMVRSALLAWYKTVRDTRGMPWRRPYDANLGPEERAQRAYEVWISEIMLQQTQVATVIPYYNRWMLKFPTIRDLAEATIDEVNALWKGLGYYSRASRLLAGAQKAVKQYGAKLPDNAKDMEANIPGIGRYSAGAICSIAYGEQVPVLDGNVHRLLSRFLALHAPPKAKSTLDVLWAGARTMVEIDNVPNGAQAGVESLDSGPQSPQYAGDINQALIELGSTVCKVREPNCDSCPLQLWCSAYQNSKLTAEEKSNRIVDIEDVCQTCEPLSAYEGVNSYPMKVDRKRAREELDLVNVIEWGKLNSKERWFLLVRRPEGGLLAGLYEFPTSADVSNSMTPVAQAAVLPEILSTLVHDGSLIKTTPQYQKGSRDDPVQTEKLAISSIQPVGDVLHVFSHIKKTYRVQRVILEGGANPPPTLVGASLHDERPSKKKKGAAKFKDVNVATHIPSGPMAVWVPLDRVMETNMGTGMVKVWNLTKKLWEEGNEI
ncbi:hypothetical protein M413DRAFT_444760 [Hebeloma cylindrosporum]|uniref:Adenine DNA glycosylase n=1 Tax=Hebeloma cylindrosporum TaxID=76867 RepID=A0A0C2YMT9_HEBCY|nr:hypothetical protein M413DRAFT_444760 [Hebeloma cylindrosporum h7]